MRVPRLSLVLAGLTVTSMATAQSSPAPWATGLSPAQPPPPALPSSTSTPTNNAVPWPTVAPPSPSVTASPLALRSPRRAPTQGADHYFQLPTARLLRLGDFQGHYIGHLGWVGLRHGLSRVVDVGVGLPYYFAGISADMRVAIVQYEGFAMSWWGYLTVPFKPRGDTAASNFGFTWAYAGMGWLTGPLFSLGASRFGAHLGLHVAQRTGLGGLWFVGHVTFDVHLHESLALLAQGLVFYEIAEETADGARALLGNGTARFLPYTLAGVRLHTRRFAADVGALVPLNDQAPLHSNGFVVLPWMSISHLF